MSADADQGLTEAALREKYPQAIISDRLRATKLHIPDDGTPLCDIPLKEGEWRMADVTAHPPAFKEFCERCKTALERENEEPQENESRAGNALAPDWG